MRDEGYNSGVSEDSLLINMLSDSDFPLREQLEGLKRDLSQEAILVVKSQVDLEVI